MSDIGEGARQNDRRLTGLTSRS